MKLKIMKNGNHLIFIDIKYACFGIETNNKLIIIKAPPIANWTIGRSLREVLFYYKKKKQAKIKKIY